MVTEKEVREYVGIDAAEQWPAYAWPGGYPIIYLCDDSEVLCPDCMNNEGEVHFGGIKDGWQIVAADVYYEGPQIICAHCGREIDSAYGDPDKEGDV